MLVIVGYIIDDQKNKLSIEAKCRGSNIVVWPENSIVKHRLKIYEASTQICSVKMMEQNEGK